MQLSPLHVQMRKAAKPLDAYLQSASELAPLAAHAARLRNLQQVLELAAPGPLAALCQVVNYKSGKVVIHAANGGVAVKLRQMGSRLADAFRCQGLEVSEVELRVQAAAMPHPAAQHTAPHAQIGSEAKHSLTSLAAALPGESPLKQALDRLLARSR